MPMLTPTKRQMREINERSPDLAKALVYWKGEAARLGFPMTTHALDEATKAVGTEIDESRKLFVNSGRRRKVV